jgi:predicted transcriptional regulator
MAASKQKMVRTSVILPEKYHAQLNKLADANDVSVAWVIRNALTQFLERNKDNKKLTFEQE